VPPLRERPEDVAVLVRHFALEMTGSEALPIAPEMLAALAEQHWAGNVRELRSAVERVVAFGATELGTMLDDASPSGAAPSVAPSAEVKPTSDDTPIERYRDAKANAVAAFERSYLASVIERCEGNASEAARRAQMDRPYLLALLRRYGLR
jgi:DNA-binding NtrC family response regulator